MVAVIATITTAVTVLQTIDEVIKLGKKFMKSVTTRDAKLEIIPVHCDLAVSFKDLTKEGVKEMDDDLKIIIAGTTRAIRDLKDVSWRNITGCMKQNALLQVVPNSTVCNSDKLLKKGANVFDVYGRTDSKIVIEVRNWFSKLINDSDVLADTKIDIDYLGRIVATTGATITSFETFFAKKEYIERRIIDIGILRFPNPDNPFFKLYRIELMAWRDTTRILVFGTDSNGITGIYNCMKFQPRQNVIKNMKKQVKEKAITIADKLFEN